MSESTVTPSRQDWLSQPLTAVMRLDWEKTIYIAFLLIAIVSRFWGLGDRVVSHDESLHTQYSYQYYNGDGYIHTPLMHGPFLFHVTSFSYWLFGHNDFTARIPVAIFGIIMVLMPYFLRDWIGRKGALFASFVLLISPYTTYYSRYIRHDVYAIVWALIIVIATFYYLRDRNEKSLWWFAGALALLFATKEISFIYVAIFGSALIIQLLLRIVPQPWFFKSFKELMMPLAIVGLGVAILAVGLGGKFMADRGAEEEATGISQPIAVDPEGEAAAEGERVDSAGFRWMQVAGIFIACAGLFMIGDTLKDYLSIYAEFDLIVLYTSLLLPSVVALLVSMVGWNPLDYNLNQCALPAQETMGAMQRFFARMGSVDCWSILFSSGIVRTLLFLGLVILVSIGIGVWWDLRRWVVAAVVFHVTFALFYTSFFTNPGGWASGTIGSLGYWLEQQEVQRGSQPAFYYAFVVPMYEFMPLIFSFVAIRWWTIRKRIFGATSFWIRTLLGGYLVYGLVNWWNMERTDHLPDYVETIVPGFAALGLVLLLALIYWWFIGSEQARNRERIGRWSEVFTTDIFLEPFPYFVWWLVMTAVAYTIAGEKMPWLSIHFVIPMAYMIGWYFNDKLSGTTFAEFFSQKAMILMGLTTLFILALFLAIGPVFTGDVAFGDLQAAGQNSVGRFIGSLLVAGGLVYLMFLVIGEVNERGRNYAWLFSSFALLSLLTVRFTYMANFPNADYTTEYLVYAHGAPATKTDIMPQLEELSLRMHGDMSLKVAYDNEASWPYTWYLRNFPNRVYFAANPTPSVTDADAILVGDANWSKIDPYVGDDYDVQEFTFLWWPMEDYRQISWETILGDLDAPPETRRSLLNSDVRRGLWEIFFYRDYEEFGDAVGKNYEIGAWPLRRQMRLYIKKEAKAMLWDYGVGATLIQLPEDPYAEGDLGFAPTDVIGSGQLAKPRNLAAHPSDGRLFVADSGNHRIVVFDPEGNVQYSFGEFGAAVGQLNEPWGIAVDEEHVYVADTWNHRVQKFTLEGTFVTVFGQSGTVEDGTTGEGLFFGPRAIALLPDNLMAVTDTGNHRVQLFNRNGEFVTMVGQLGALAGEFYEPVGLASSADGRLYVADTWNERVQELVLDPVPFAVMEKEVAAWDNSQSIENKPFMAVDDNGRIYVTDPEGYRVIVFDSEMNYLGRFGTYSTDVTGFGLPNGVAVGPDGSIYVADGANSVILKFASPLE